MPIVTQLRAGRLLFLTCVGLFCLSSPLRPFGLPHLWAQDLSRPKYRLQVRENAAGQEDRREGIAPMQITGERLQLIGAFLKVPALSPTTKSATYRLGFYLAEAESRVRIRVRDYDVFRGMNFIYWMLPLRTRYAPGFQTFAWDATLAQELGIELQALGAVAWIRGHGRPAVAPLLLYTGEFPARMRVQGCRFVFTPNTTMTVAYRMYPMGQKTRVLQQGQAIQWHRQRPHAVVWDGTDAQGHPLPEGRYILAVEAAYQPAPGSPEKTLPFDVAFYYTPVIEAR
jgi:hypothetical protein